MTRRIVLRTTAVASASSSALTISAASASAPRVTIVDPRSVSTGVTVALPASSTTAATVVPAPGCCSATTLSSIVADASTKAAGKFDGPAAKTRERRSVKVPSPARTRPSIVVSSTVNS